MQEHDDLIRRFTGMRASVLGYLRVLVRDAHLAEDLFQETCLVVLRKVAEFDPSGDFGAWVRGIALNLARNVLRKERYVHLMPSPNLAEAIERTFASATAAEDEELALRLERLGECMEQVGSRQRKLLELRYQGRATIREIAQRTGRTEGAVQVALSRVRQFLLKCIERHKGRVSHGYGPA